MKKTTLILTTILAIVAATAISLFFIYKSSNINPPLKIGYQEPTKPYGYYSEEVSFQNNEANLTLRGTLTLPATQGRYPAVILIAGSGPNTRDEEEPGHKPFLILADYLTKQGIAVLRYDDRGVGQSSGNYTTATALDFASDVKSAMAYLKTRKEINENKIGLVGHSEGGMVAPMVATTSSHVSFLVLLAAPGISISQLVRQQRDTIAKVMGVPDSIIARSNKIDAEMLELIAKAQDWQTLKDDLMRYAMRNHDRFPTYFKPVDMTTNKFIVDQIRLLSTPGFEYFIKYDPAPTLAKVSCPVLALNGEKDLQVLAKENLPAISEALKKGGNTDVTIKELAKLNHLFQECETGSPTEYATIKQTFSPVALAEIAEWITKQVK